MRFFRWLLHWLGPLFQKAPVKPPTFEVDLGWGKQKVGAKKPHGLPGSKVARRMMKARGLPYDGEVFHTGELTEANNERARRRYEARG